MAGMWDLCLGFYWSEREFEVSRQNPIGPPKIGPAGPILAEKFCQNWSPQTTFAAKIGPVGPVLAAKTGPTEPILVPL